ncbi:hypothetical protein LTR56_015085 [Elasticomyces elasticus]|nr:hypothetical protein LTR56_015085 [Elasticomyces elasticus]KAK3639307.1 hypothetical protein LTR22_017508 [Elasticomyces elasticus]KAK4915720.1 hypothetical protein LTR49_016204 [Elasticomyces elasticus]KAK5746071.1 hypothetical protein LTS12_022885 [Elasticomyces elasticus]
MSGAVHHLLGYDVSKQSHVNGDFLIDDGVLATLPQATKILSAQRYGTSAWTVTARIKARLPDGSETRYFLKCASEESGRVMIEGEFHAMSELYKRAPDLVPKPYAWGKYKADHPETYFFLQQYIEMSNCVPEPNQLCEKLAKLHRTSVSPNGCFGFHITTCQGSIPQSVGWETSWTTFFAKLLKHVVELDLKLNGRWEDLETLEQRIFSHVVPRLIGNLERDERSVRPCLIHADLWEGNTGTSYEDNAVYIFDSGAYYAHDEMEIGDWRCHYNKIHDAVYTETYLRHNGPSEPKEEWDDRNRMYSIYYNVVYSCNHMSQGKAVRQV